MQPSNIRPSNPQSLAKSKSPSHKISTRTFSQSITNENGNTPLPPPLQDAGSEPVSMVIIIAGSGGGLVGVAALLLFARKRFIENKRQSSAADWVESKPNDRRKSSRKDLIMSDLSLGPDSPAEDLGSLFITKKPAANLAGGSSVSAIVDRGTSNGGVQENSSGHKPQTGTKQVSEFGKHVEVLEVSFSELDPIGSGAFGLVYRVELSSGIVAVKVPRVGLIKGSKEYDEILAEAEFLSKLRHTNINVLSGYGHHPSGNVIFVMEFADCSLADVLKSGPLKSDLLADYAHGIVRGLLYLHIHSPPISHRDLKPENVLLVDGVVKLSDFGLATAKDFVSKTTGFARTSIWSPPEAFEGKFSGPPGDVYSFGLLLWSMITGSVPYDKFQREGIFLIKSKNQVPVIPSTCPPNLSKIMKLCWKMNPSHRMTASLLEAAFSDIRNF